MNLNVSIIKVKTDAAPEVVKKQKKTADVTSSEEEAKPKKKRTVNDVNAAILKELGQQGLPNLCCYFKNTEWNVGIGKTTGNEEYYYILKKNIYWVPI